MRVNVRLIAATNTHLAEKVSEKQFRSDLYYRLNVFPILIPPLRKRPEDIPLLVSHFVQKYTRQMKKRIDTIPAAAMKALSEYDWPGNVRELENVIERAVILSRGSQLEPLLANWQNQRSRLQWSPHIAAGRSKKLNGGTSCGPSRRQSGSSQDPPVRLRDSG
jgi:transcriptional regulator with GAF, ATPase, and Fis domain